MDEKVMALSALDAAQKSAEWAYWSMLGTWVSAAATLIAALVALWAIKGWRQHEEALELREIRITAYNFHLTLIRAPKYNAEDLDERDFIAVQATFNAMNDIYLSTIKMHDAVKRGHASEVYQKNS